MAHPYIFTAERKNIELAIAIEGSEERANVESVCRDNLQFELVGQPVVPHLGLDEKIASVWPWSTAAFNRTDRLRFVLPGTCTRRNRVMRGPEALANCLISDLVSIFDTVVVCFGMPGIRS